jgi:branched-chain amino acid transport system ATP-binding protein
MLNVKQLTKSFGGVKAVEEVSFSVSQGAIHAVIGPNGAGKTTLFNLISGVYEPTAGEVFFNEEDIAGMPPDQLARRGMSRTFQNLQICMNMTACENVMLGAHLRLNHGLVSGMLFGRKLAGSDRSCEQEAKELMEFAGVGRYVKAHATEMSFGALKRLEIARALAVKPKMLLLDEPAAGLNHTETAEISSLIQKIAKTGITVLLVEHDMKMVMSISNHILVLDYGKKLAEGTAEQVSRDPAVVAAYLGAA